VLGTAGQSVRSAFISGQEVLACFFSTNVRPHQDPGRIVEHGTHESLYVLHGRYWDLYTRQHGVEMNMLSRPA
jgi:hypothetical protein